MAKSEKRIRARTLRRKGKSINDISKTIGVSKSSVSKWCSDILLTKKQIKVLKDKQIKSGSKALLEASEKRKKERLEKVNKYIEKGSKRMSNVKKEEFFVSGLAMYLGEGYKKGRSINFANSNPEIMKFMIKWFITFFQVDKDRFTFRVMINKAHKNRVKEVKEFWIKKIGIEEYQWRKIQLLGPIPKKKYENHKNHYGTLSFKILKSTNLFYEVKGLMYGLLKNINKDFKLHL